VSISVYSVFTAFLWFNVFILILGLLRSALGPLLKNQLSPLIVAIVLSLLRLLIPFEPSFSVIVRSERFLPSVLQLLRTECITVGTVSLSWEIMIVFIASLVSLILLLHYICGLQMDQKKLDRFQPTDNPRVRAIFEQMKRDNPCDCQCDVYIINYKDAPCTFYFKGARIILPQSIYTKSDEQINLILRHEYLHVLKKDCMIRVLMHGLCCLMWWNPLMWLLSLNLNQTLELKCDANVIKNSPDEQMFVYLETLMDSARKPSKIKFSSAIPLSGIPAFTKKSTKNRLIQRFDFIGSHFESSKDTKDAKGIKSIAGSICIAFLIILFAISFCFTVQPFGVPPMDSLISDSPNQELLQIVPETSYLVDNHDGTYSLYVN